MANFEIAYENVLTAEGGYVDHPNDRGGETYKGVARNFHPTWKGWEIIDSCKVESAFPRMLEGNAALQEHVHAFYKAEFWDKVKGDSIKQQELAEEMFDTAVNMGVKYGGLFLQKTLNILNNQGKRYPDIGADGAIGPVTLDTLAKFFTTVRNEDEGVQLLLFWMNMYQGARYIAIAESNPTQEVFIRGWSKRAGIRDYRTKIVEVESAEQSELGVVKIVFIHKGGEVV
jgi:lysozyme family protein